MSEHTKERGKLEHDANRTWKKKHVVWNMWSLKGKKSGENRLKCSENRRREFVRGGTVRKRFEGRWKVRSLKCQEEHGIKNT